MEDCETNGEVVPDSLGEGAEGVTEGTTVGVVESGTEGTTGVLSCGGALDAGALDAGALDAGGVHVFGAPGTQLKFIPTTPIGT